ncbi:MAG: hypothetical protein U0Q16_32580 [Bryobacteraceae bacterium]
MAKQLLGMTAAMLVAAGVMCAADRPAVRQRNQQARIAQGVRSGELTRPEARRLERQEAQLHREIVRDRVDGGGLSLAERAKIERQQNAMSRRIWNQKHDAQTR